MGPCIGVLALQGAFREHRRALERCGAAVREVRRRKDMDGMDAVVIPGGESTTMGKLLVDSAMLEPLRGRIQEGMPAYGSCAGLILLCADIEDRPDQPRLGVLDASVRRNAFGRQVDSFTTELALAPLTTVDGGHAEPSVVEAVFIRAPLIEKIGSGVEVLASVNGLPVAVRQGNILALSFHPELTNDLRFHQWVVDMAEI